jgi:hypothetical protein
MKPIFKRSLFAVSFAFAIGSVHATEFNRPDALLQVDLNRPAVVERITNNWSKELPAAKREAFKEKLMNLRADQLLAANISGTFEGVLEVMDSHEKAHAALQKMALTDEAKSVGEASRDLVYTPITPCRFLDTRNANSPINAGGQFAAGEVRAYQLTGNCGIPTGAAAAVTQIIMITPPAAGDIELLPQGGTFGNSVAMVFQAGVYSSVSMTTRLNASNGQFSTQVRGSGGHVAMDITGYFMPPSRAGDGLRSLTLPGQTRPNIILGDSSNTVVQTSGTMVGAAIGGGTFNTVGDSTGAGGHFGTVAGGYGNRAGSISGAGGDFATVGGGWINNAAGAYSTVPGGFGNSALSNYSFAAGTRAKTTRPGQFVWSDLRPFDFSPEAQGFWAGNVENTFVARATGGVLFTTGINAIGKFTTYCAIDGGGAAWYCTSDRAVKHSIKSISPKAILNKLIKMPVTTWAFNGSNVRNMGPMAQDFKAAFGLGTSDKAIGHIDAQGVAFAAIQGLNQVVNEKDAKITALEKANAAMQRELAAIKKKLGL